MLSRRHLLLGASAVVPLLAIDGSGALALSSEPMAAEDLRALSLACGDQTSHIQLLNDARLMLDDEIQAGLKPADATVTVVCPLCHCAFNVAPDIRF